MLINADTCSDLGPRIITHQHCFVNTPRTPQKPAQGISTPRH